MVRGLGAVGDLFGMEWAPLAERERAMGRPGWTKAVFPEELATLS